ncbi:MAG: hypothetical protein IJF88_01300 [Oscillospiraceae bacterium]|nr:hypothetical protein [Oscillospiraceae bacterium]
MEDAKYGIAEFAKMSRRLFGVPPEAAMAALREAGLDMAGRKEAEDAIKAFMEKEVR